MTFFLKIEDYMLPCLTKKFLGIECFGCGIQRAIILIFQGEFQAAFKMYPAIYLMLAFVFFICLNFFDKKRDYHKLIIFLGIFTAFVMVISYFYKHFF